MRGSHIDDATEVLLAHRRQCQPRGVECGRQIDRQDLIPFLDRKLVERCDVLNAGIVDENVEPTKVGQRRCDHLGDLVWRRHIGRRIAGLDAVIGFYRVLCPGDLGRGAEAVQHHVCARRGERAGDAKPDPAG